MKIHNKQVKLYIVEEDNQFFLPKITIKAKSNLFIVKFTLRMIKNLLRFNKTNAVSIKTTKQKQVWPKKSLDKRRKK